jgi:ribosome biogenesis GTPase / thiamine phosphate phosphatase
LTAGSIDQVTALSALGWSEFFGSQISIEEQHLVPMRILSVHRARLSAQSRYGPQRLEPQPNIRTTDFAVGDWVLVEPSTQAITRLLERKTLLQRQAETGLQLIAANIDTLFIVTSCNDDFSPARLERYLALANEADVNSVIVLTKIDKVDDAQRYFEEAKALQRGLQVVMLNAKSPDAAAILAPWCGVGQTVALIGSSGVGKSTLLNTLTAKPDDEGQQTGSVRLSDDKGRHTTTSRSLRQIAGRGLVIDTPGMRTLCVSDMAGGIDQLFSEIVELAPNCRFRDCTHDHEPGCAVQAALASGTIDAARFERWRKLSDENRGNRPTAARQNERKAANTKGGRQKR